MHDSLRTALGGCAFAVPASMGFASASDLIEVKRLAMGLAREIASTAVTACRERGYQVTAVVVDRNDDPQVMIRDSLAPRFTIEIAQY